MSVHEDQESFYDLSYYTLEHSDPALIHQYVVDAYGAQTIPLANSRELANGIIGVV